LVDDRSAALLIRVWTEDSSDFRARLMTLRGATAQAPAEEVTVVVASSPGGVLDAVRDWLDGSPGTPATRITGMGEPPGSMTRNAIGASNRWRRGPHVVRGVAPRRTDRPRTPPAPLRSASMRARAVPGPRAGDEPVTGPRDHRHGLRELLVGAVGTRRGPWRRGVRHGRAPRAAVRPVHARTVDLAVWMGGACRDVDRHRWNADPLTQEPR
jgi:hypothetical protein